MYFPLYHYFLLPLSLSLTETQTSGDGRVFSSPNSYGSSLSPLLLSPVPFLRHCHRIHLPGSLALITPLSRISSADIFRYPSPPLNHSPPPPCISTHRRKVSNFPPFLPPPPSLSHTSPSLSSCAPTMSHPNVPPDHRNR